MAFLKKLWNKTFLGITTSLISDSYVYIKDKNLIKDTLYSKEFNLVLKQYLKTDFKKDWIGRLYGVINPNINIQGNLDVNNIVIEIDGDNTNNNEYVKIWVYKQMQLIATLFKIEKLYDYIDIDFSHVGPENMDNYLVVFDIVSRKVFAESLKRFFKRLFILGILFVIGFVSFKFFI